MPVITTEIPYFALYPDWACEVLSPSTAVVDRVRKLPIYAREKVGHVWLVDPLLRTLEVLRRHEASWLVVATYQGDAKIRAESFDAIELELGILWADVQL
jgi:Uma2 family endonuclease